MLIEQDFRDAMAGVCAPVTIVTTSERGSPYGVTVSAFASVSLRPAMVSVALDRSSRVLARILAKGRFGVNVLGRDQDELARIFAGPSPDRFAASEAPWRHDHGLPRLAGAAGWIVCELGSTVEAGDHLLLLGDVTHVRSSSAAPLVYSHRVFGTHSAFAR
ncbi:flavin reductase family protein [Streptomyces violascens]|uniref:flavin reductase family protein n=1 Tax=Streptomyces violascens TaxID=67381 RepID=UPI001E4093AE|nr:flavin reductase family protein [Streptomyces violascens]